MMNNADKFLKDGVSAREFIEALEKYGADTSEIKTFLIEQVQSTLTENKPKNICEQLKQCIDGASNYFVEVLGFDEKIVAKAKEDFLKSHFKSTLTEDERAILRNIDIKNYDIIGKNALGVTFITSTKDSDKFIWVDNVFEKKLFHFIKERRRIFY